MHADFEDLLSTFTDHAVEYLVVGAHALAAHGLERASSNLEVWVRPSTENAARVFQALADFGSPMLDLSEDELAAPGFSFPIGVPPMRIDVITSIDGVDFSPAWADRLEVDVAGLRVPVLSRHHLVQNKRAAGRLQDLADVAALESRAPER